MGSSDNNISSASKILKIYRHEKGSVTSTKGQSDAQISQHEASDELAIEEPLEIRVNHRSVSVTMRTPGNDEELALGFLLSEGILKKTGDWISVRHYSRNQFGNVIDVFLNPDVDFDFQKLTRHVFGSSSCGLCGKATLESVLSISPPELQCAIGNSSAEEAGENPDSNSFFESDQSIPWVEPRLLWQGLESVQQSQQRFQKTGGLHAAAILNQKGDVLLVREDIGRHNALDKVLGYSLKEGWIPLNGQQTILWVSGRISFELMQKAWAGGLKVIAGVSAPSSLAVEFAKKTGMTLIGFLRENRMNVYHGAWRLVRE